MANEKQSLSCHMARWNEKRDGNAIARDSSQPEQNRRNAHLQKQESHIRNFQWRRWTLAHLFCVCLLLALLFRSRSRVLGGSR